MGVPRQELFVKGWTSVAHLGTHVHAWTTVSVFSNMYSNLEVCSLGTTAGLGSVTGHERLAIEVDTL